MGEENTAVLQIRLPPALKRQAQKDAHRLEVSTAEYIRRLLETGHSMIERAEK